MKHGQRSDTLPDWSVDLETQRRDPLLISVFATMLLIGSFVTIGVGCQLLLPPGIREPTAVFVITWGTLGFWGAVVRGWGANLLRGQPLRIEIRGSHGLVKVAGSPLYSGHATASGSTTACW